MGLVTLSPAGRPGGGAVVGCNVLLPRVGAWTADLELDQASTVAGKVELSLGPHTLAGSVDHAEVVAGRLQCRVVAGAAGLRELVVPKHYTSPTVGVVLKDILQDVGELVSPTADQAVLSQQLEHWTTLRQPAGRAIGGLLLRAGHGVAWRHLADGTVWVGRETWPESDVVSFSEISRNGASDRSEIALVHAEPIWPGTTLDGRQVDYVDLRLTGGATRATVFYRPPKTTPTDLVGSLSSPRPERDRVMGSFAVLAGLDPAAPYHRLYAGRILEQRPYPNLKVTVQPDDRDLPPMTDIPFRTGVAGIAVVLKLRTAGKSTGPAPTCLIGWEDGRPDKPYAALWAAGQRGASRDQIARLIIEGTALELGAEGLSPLDGVLTGRSIDPFTGQTHAALQNSSTVVLAKKT